MENENNPNMTFSSNEEIGKRISALRKKRHINQASLAEKLGKSLRTVQKYESGEIEISISIANQLAAILETSPEFILGYSEPTHSINSFADIAAFLFELEDIANLDFDIHIERPPYSTNWICSLWFNGLDHDAELNQEMCRFLELWSHQKHLLKSRADGYQIWKEQYIALQKDYPVFSLATPGLREHAQSVYHRPGPPTSSNSDKE